MKRLETGKVYQKAYQINRVETALLELFVKGELRGTVHTCLGQELISAVFSQLVGANDVVFSNHRCHGHFLATHDRPYQLIAEVMGKSTGVVQGLGGSQHLITKNFYANGILGGATALACGRAFALKRRKENGIAVCFIGDGALHEGIVYEAMNLAVKWKLPMLFVLENNGIAQSTLQSETLAGSIQGRAEAFGLEYLKADIWNPEALFDQMQRGISQAQNFQASFLEVGCYRLAPHSKGDDQRPASERAHYLSIDPLQSYIQQMSDGESTAFKKIAEAIQQDIKNAQESVALPKTTYALKSVPTYPQGETKGTLVARLNSSLQTWLAGSTHAVFVGEDVRDPYGGAFKVSKGLSTKFPEQVFNFPTSEAALVGFASGAAMGGVTLMVEIMFADFLGLAFDQLYNHATKLQPLSQNTSWGNFLIRTPSGGGRGYGPTHGQSLEKYFAVMPGLHVFLLHHRSSIANFYASLMGELVAPTLVFEPKSLYDSLPEPLPADWAMSVSPMHTTTLSSHADADITLVALGAMGLMAEEAMKQLSEEEVQVDLILPLVLHQLDLQPILHSLRKTGRLVITEEATEGGGFSDRLISQLHSQASFTYRVVCSPSGIVPAAANLEQEFLPSTQRIFEACCEVFDE